VGRRCGGIEYQVKVIAQADSLGDVLTAGINPAHYKKLRAIDATSFLGVVADARNTIADPVKDLEAGGRLLRRFYGYLIFRASNEAILFGNLPDDQQLAAIAYTAPR